MNTPIETLLHNIVQKVNEKYPISGYLGSKPINANAKDFPALIFEVENETDVKEDFLRGIRVDLNYILCFDSEDLSEQIELDKFEELRTIYMHTWNAFRDVDLLTIENSSKKPYYFDIQQMNVKTKGFLCRMTFFVQAQTLC